MHLLLFFYSTVVSIFQIKSKTKQECQARFMKRATKNHSTGLVPIQQVPKYDSDRNNDFHTV